MAFGNTVKEGTGTSYWLLQDDLGRLRINDEWTPELNVEEAANDSDKTISVPASEEWEIISIWVENVTSSDAGTRQIQIDILDDSSDIIATIIAGATQIESLTRNYLFAFGVADLTSFRDTLFLTTPIPKLKLPAGYKIRIYDNNAIAASADDMVVQILNNKRDV